MEKVLGKSFVNVYLAEPSIQVTSLACLTQISPLFKGGYLLLNQMAKTNWDVLKLDAFLQYQIPQFLLNVSHIDPPCTSAADQGNIRRNIRWKRTKPEIVRAIKQNWSFQNKPISYIISLSSNELNSHQTNQKVQISKKKKKKTKMTDSRTGNSCQSARITDTIRIWAKGAQQTNEVLR